jgi:hypothetical protein
MKLMRQWIWIVILLAAPHWGLGQANTSDNSCFPISRSKDDWKCYDFSSEQDCLDTTDSFSCGWGLRNENHEPDSEQLICENSRCPNLETIEDEDDQ